MQGSRCGAHWLQGQRNGHDHRITLAALLFLLTGLAVMTVAVRATDAAAAPSDYWYATSWPLPAHDPASTQYYNVARDTAGNIFVSDEYNYRVLKYSGDGNLRVAWGGRSYPDQFNMPMGIVCDGSGTIYVADEANNRVMRLGTDGWWYVFKAYTSFTGYPSDVACDADNNVYVIVWHIMAMQHIVYKYSASGTLMTQWGGLMGSGNGFFRNPRGIACDSFGHVYVADTDNHRIQKFDTNGVYLGQWSGDGPAALFGPRGLVCDSAGNVVVADTGHDQVTVFGPGGALVTTVGHTGTGAGEFRAPSDVALGVGDTIYVADGDNSRIQVFAHDTTAPLTTATPSPAPNAAGWNKGAVTVALSASDDLSGAARTEYRLLGAVGWTTYAAPFAISDNGVKSYECRSVDVAGNVEATKTVTVRIDTTRPRTKALANAGVRRNRRVTLRLRANDAISPKASLTVKIYKGRAVKKTLKLGLRQTNTEIRCRYLCRLPRGRYSWKVYAVDLAGNKQKSIAPRTLTVR